MESVHQSSRRTWIDDEIIIVREFLEEFSNEVLSITQSSGNSEEELLRQIEEECGLDALRCDFQESVELTDKLDIPEGVELKTLRAQKEDLEKRKKDRKYASARYHRMKYTNYPIKKILKIDHDEFVPVNVPEVVLVVQIYRPQRKIDPKVVNHVKTPSFHVDQEFSVLGCQYLTELRDSIDCVSDKAIPGDYSDCPSSLPKETCKDIYKSGFFYIHSVFYNDMRDKDCRDYSETIIKWSKNRGIGPFQKAVMEETRFIDLTIQLGYPYVYIHQGDCEHIVVFTDLRLFSESDESNRNAYPLQTKIRQTKRTFCMLCHAFTAIWVVYDNKRLPETPYFFCNRCFLSFNYDENNKKIGEFRAYHLPDRSKLF